MSKSNNISFSEKVKRSIRESALWMLGALAFILWLALVTYHLDDPGIAQINNSNEINNAIGQVGAFISDLLFNLFGISAYLFVGMIFYYGWLLYVDLKNTDSTARADLFLRVCGFLLLLVSSSALTTLHFSAEGFNQTAGGILGQAVGGYLESTMKLLGASTLLFFIWLTSISLFLSISWFKIMDEIGRVTVFFWNKIVIKIDALKDQIEGKRIQAERQSIIKAEKKRIAKRAPPKIEPVISPLETSGRAEKERQVALFEPSNEGELPSLSLLDDPPPQKKGFSGEALEAMSRLVELKLKDFGIEVEVVSVSPGPIITRFELDPAPGIKVNKISILAKDLARSLSVVSVRIVEVIPGKSFIGLEIPNENRELVTLGEILKSKVYDDMASPLTLALGKDIGGNSVVADLAKMPHLLIAGTTGSGKSVAINAMILSLLYKATAEHVRLIMVDPKMLELSVYEGIPHLLTPVVTDMKDAANALRWSVTEMDRRYRLMAALGVRNIGGYNKKVKDAIAEGKPIPDPLYKPPDLIDDDATPHHPTLGTLPFIVIVIDELADMMMIVGKKTEELIARLAQKARASGIHMLLATQRPSVDVITGLIKANVPSRIAFQVSAKVDSRTILDQMGAETLLGHGDMLYLPPGTSLPTRVHGAFVADNEVHAVVESLKTAGKPQYIEEILEANELPGSGLVEDADAEKDVLYDQAVQIVIETKKASISGVQRRLKIGYNRAARMVEAMEAAGLVGPLESNGSREILISVSTDD
ncbi:DNA translocase FtsK 4TM domain-containing protein [Woeseiaceae bacterium]|nr:DNA translocase FtsK 4TM domain-containing protein [Woeseiaceae bacterium]